MIRFLLLGCVLVLTIGGRPTSAVAIHEADTWGEHFRAAGVQGTFVLQKVGADERLVHDARRAARPLLPASTFKVVHSLIALETGVIDGPDHLLPWDGTERWVRSWNRDHTLSSAIRHSVVWYYQELARRIGHERMRDHLQRVGYGNSDIGGGIDTFWLSGDLRISALGQVDFLARLHQEDLPFSPPTLSAVKEILVEERGEGYVLRSKTGWAQSPDPDIGWYVGYLVRGSDAYAFALNIDIERREQARLRRAVARAILKDQGLLAREVDPVPKASNP